MIRRLILSLLGVGRPDPEKLLSDLASSHPGGGYPLSMDRYRDFRAVFLDEERGRRVLYEILSWGHVFRPSPTAPPIDPYLMAFREGERNMALQILSALHAEPKDKPERTVNRRKA